MKKNQVFPLLILLAIIAGVSSLIFLYAKAHAGDNGCQDRTYPSNQIKIIRMAQKHDLEWGSDHRQHLSGMTATNWDCVAMSWNDRFDLWEDPSLPTLHTVWTSTVNNDWYVYGFMPGEGGGDVKYSDMDVDVVCFHKDIADLNPNRYNLNLLFGSQGLFEPNPVAEHYTHNGLKCRCVRP